MATDNFFQFEADWKALAEKAHATVGQVMRATALRVWTEITSRTPVDTGRARANWNLTVGAPSSEVREYPNAKTGEIPFPAAPDITQIDGSKDVFIVNNLPYIEALEHGHSQQAPNGMVALSIQAVKAEEETFLREE